MSASGTISAHDEAGDQRLRGRHAFFPGSQDAGTARGIRLCLIAACRDLLVSAGYYSGWSLLAADLVRRRVALVHQVRDEALGCVREVVAVVHPDARVVGPEDQVDGLVVLDVDGVDPDRAAGDGLPLRAVTSAWWPCRCMGCASPLWLSMRNFTTSPLRTMNIGTSGHMRPLIVHQ